LDEGLLVDPNPIPSKFFKANKNRKSKVIKTWPDHSFDLQSSRPQSISGVAGYLLMDKEVVGHPIKPFEVIGDHSS
jgi:hypothetical protein